MNIKTGYEYLPLIRQKLLDKGFTKKQLPNKMLKEVVLEYERGLWFAIRKGWVFNTPIFVKPIETKPNILLILRMYGVQNMKNKTIKYKSGYVKKNRKTPNPV